MPIYEYRCAACAHQFERMQKFSDPPVETCPQCTGQVQKLISRSAFHLKGSGWYVTDYGRNGSTTSGSDKSSATESSDTKSDTGGETAKSATSDTSSSTEKSSTAEKSTTTSTAAA